MKERIDDLTRVLQSLILKDAELYRLVLPILCQERLVYPEELVDLPESIPDKLLDLFIVSFVEFVAYEPLIEAEVVMVGLLPLGAHPVVPILKHSLVRVKVLVPVEPLVNLQTLHTLNEALTELLREAIAIRLGFEPQAAQALHFDSLMHEEIGILSM